MTRAGQSATFYFLLPCFNEAENIEGLVSSIDRAMKGFGFSYRIVAIDDGSNDNTLGILKSLAKNYSIELVVHEQNKGLPAAITSGLVKICEMALPQDVLVTMDGDLTHDPQFVEPMMEQIQKGADLVIASRFQPGSKVFGLSFKRTLISIRASQILSLILRVPGAKDYTCGYRLIRMSKVLMVKPNIGRPYFLSQKGFSCTLEFLLKLSTIKNLKVSEVPFELHYERKKGASKMRVIDTAIGVFKILNVYRRNPLTLGD